MHNLAQRAALTAEVAALGAFGVPAAATAAVTPIVDGNVLTVISNAEPDTITLGAAGGALTVNGVPTTLSPNPQDQVKVFGNGGDDTVDASALPVTSYGQMNLNGGDGDDLLMGGAGDDTLAGDLGDDRLIGSKGSDRLQGKDGNDTMVWNNGDGSDHDDGDFGTDELEVNAAPVAGDVFTAAPDSDAGRARIDRTNLVGFGIDFAAERLTVNLLGGADTFTAQAGLGALTALTVNGGGGNDTVTGADGPEQLNGAGGNDTLIGGGSADIIRGGDGDDAVQGDAGDDRLIGDRGSDVVRGDAGDDTLVWNDGDGSDVHAGDAGFDRVEVNGSTTAADVFTVRPANDAERLARPTVDATFERTNLVPFSIAIDRTTEALSVTGGAGDDAFTAQPGLARLLVAADGGSGNDSLSGGDENDSLFGGPGNDALRPGGGSDIADGGDGDDVLFTRDTVGDLVRGGAGNDSAQTDATTVDATDGVEALDATILTPPGPTPAGPVSTPAGPVAGPARDTKALVPRIGKARVTRHGGRLVARVPLTCASAEVNGCTVTMTLQTARAIHLGTVQAVLILGSQAARLRAGQTSTVSVKLAHGAEAMVRHGKLATRARVATTDRAGNSASQSVRLTLRVPRR